MLSDSIRIRSVGIYEQSGLSGYQVVSGSLPNNNTVVFGDQGPNFPVTWNPRYAFAVSTCLLLVSRRYLILYVL